MLLKQLFAQERPLLSFEVFPPKPDYSLESIYRTLDELYRLRPGFISVTYGAGGSNRGRTLEIARHIREAYQIESVAHLTCVGHTRQEISELLGMMKISHIENILALRGDFPQGTDLPKENMGDFHYAHELISFIKSTSQFFLGAAAYPEGHPQSQSLADDTIRLKEKVEKGVDYLITQLFLDNQIFFKFIERIRESGIQVPVSAGIMPVLNGRIQRIIELSKATIPKKLAAIIERFEDSPEDMEKAGIEYAVDQIDELIRFGVEGIHLYTMNKVDQTIQIVKQIKTYF
jgi:methylenetetrahydrofolate reductase (NADPH)